VADLSTAILESEITLRRPASLELRDVAKHYGGLHAVDGVSATVEPGEVLGVAGPNGAGKTTLFDVITGLTPPTGGDVLLGGRSLTGASVHDRCHAGMARTFQQPTVAGSLNVYENILVSARYSRAADRWSGLGGKARDDAERVLSFSHLDSIADEPAELLGVFDKKRLMIATALAMGPSVLLLDEPFGGLNPGEIVRTVELIRGVAALGVTVVCIEHVMRALVQIAARVLVMHHGRVFFEGTPQEMLKDRRVIEIYLGEKAARRAQA
jgi:ABC-type branched-subunit amino acid transport system ATPase component